MSEDKDPNKVVAKKICDHCHAEIDITEDDVWDDGWIKDVKCPSCVKIVHVWFKTLFIDKQLHSDTCDVIKAGLGCLWLECGIGKDSYDTAKKFAQLMDSPGGKSLLEWLNKSETISRVDKE